MYWTASVGAPLSQRHHCPMRLTDEAFFEALYVLDERESLIAAGRPRPQWAFYDCVLFPGRLYGASVGEIPIAVAGLCPRLGGGYLLQSLAGEPEEAERALLRARKEVHGEALWAIVLWDSPGLAVLERVGRWRVMQVSNHATDVLVLAATDEHADAGEGGGPESWDALVRRWHAGDRLILGAR